MLRCSGPKHLTMTMTRAKLEGLVKDLLERTKQPCVQCLKVRGAEGKGQLKVARRASFKGQLRGRSRGRIHCSPSIQYTISNLYHRQNLGSPHVKSRF